MEARLMKHELKYNKQKMKSLSEPLDDDQVVGACEDAKMKITTLKRGVNRCQADKCSVDLNDAKPYHRRHKVCEHHAKAQVVLLAGIRQRYCQQCSRFHEVSEFDEAKRSCRRRLAGHNERRRKNPNPNTSSNSKAEGSIRMEGSGAGTTTNGHYQTKNYLRPA